MSKDKKTTISFEYEGADYKLEFTASSLKRMEKNGFNFTEIEKYALSAPEELFCGAFIANHQRVPHAKRVEIYNEICGTSEDGAHDLTEVLSDMVAEAIEELTTHSGNVKWRVEK